MPRGQLVLIPAAPEEVIPPIIRFGWSMKSSTSSIGPSGKPPITSRSANRLLNRMRHRGEVRAQRDLQPEVR